MFGKKKKRVGEDGEELRYPEEEQSEGYDTGDGDTPDGAIYEEYSPEAYGDYEERSWGAEDEEEWETH